MDSSTYLIRLDDACPTMHHENWRRIESLLDSFGIRPMVGVIPDNYDNTQQYSPADAQFWYLVRSWQAKGWTIAMHGYKHLYHTTEKGGLNPMWHRSEFTGLPLNEQREKIRNGIAILKSQGLTVRYFFAPSHTFDRNTLEALRLETDIRCISDTIANRPYRKYGFTFIPQFGSMPRKMPVKGIYTVCLHPSEMHDDDFILLEERIKALAGKFTTFDEIQPTAPPHAGKTSFRAQCQSHISQSENSEV